MAEKTIEELKTRAASVAQSCTAIGRYHQELVDEVIALRADRDRAEALEVEVTMLRQQSELDAAARARVLDTVEQLKPLVGQLGALKSALDLLPKLELLVQLGETVRQTQVTDQPEDAAAEADIDEDDEEDGPG